MSLSSVKTAAVFGCTPEQANAQARKNLAQLKGMHSKALASGRRVNGYTATDLEHMIFKFRKGWNL